MKKLQTMYFFYYKYAGKQSYGPLDGKSGYRGIGIYVTEEVSCVWNYDGSSIHSRCNDAAMQPNSIITNYYKKTFFRYSD